MIIDTLISLMTGLFGALLSWLPNFNGLPSWLHNTLQFVGGAINSLDFIIPMDILWWCFLSVLSLEIGIQIWNFVKYVTNTTRGVATNTSHL